LEEVTLEEQRKVDEQWKTQIDQEKKQADQDNAAYHEPNFKVFVSSLSMQAMIALGKIENPITKKAEANYEQARFLIDTLQVLKEKTKNNLESEEEKLLEESLFSLRMMYVEAKKDGK